MRMWRALAWTPSLVTTLAIGPGCGSSPPPTYPDHGEDSASDTGVPTGDDAGPPGGTDRGDEPTGEDGNSTTDDGSADDESTDGDEDETGTDSSDSDGETGTDGTGDTGNDEGDSGDHSDTDTDTDDTGDGTDGTDTDDPSGWNFANVHGVPNLDDDDEDGTDDWDQALFAEDDDPSELLLAATVLEQVPPGGHVRLELSGETADIRVWYDDTPILGATSGGTTVAYDLEPTGDDVVLWIEFADFRAAASLAVSNVDAMDNIVDRDDVDLVAAPLLLNHHLQPAEHVWAVDLGNDNAAFISGYQQALGSRFTTVDGNDVGDDRWIQDEIEYATATGESRRLDIVIDSIRDRGLRNYAETLAAPDQIVRTWGTPGAQTTYDSFGNLEASPPVDVGGQAYPFGRIYYGRKGNVGLHADLAGFLAAQELQAPFEVDTLWLCVGHVDEISSFIPDPSAPKGFKLLFSDVPAAYDLLDSLPASGTLGHYATDHGYATVGDLADDDGLRALNEDLQADYLTPILQQFKTELGLTDDDVILVPSLFEVTCEPGQVAALIPGMVNLIVANFAGETPHLFVPDPFFRPSGAPQSDDPIIAAFRDAMPAGLEMTFLDDWNAYHMRMGEVHCGTNVTRTPTASWWREAPATRGGY